MLQLKDIVKTYRIGDLTQDALNGVSITCLLYTSRCV